jgi:TRAP-type C4-dicarboxylate transport system permease small subunit
MTAVYDQLPKRMRKALMAAITAATSAILLALAWYAASYVRTLHELGGIYPALRVPFFVVYAVAPAGLFLAGVQYGLAALRNLTEPEIYLSVETKDEYEEPITQEI